MKKKTLAGLISSLICISLIGVGFASWVITGDAEDKTQGGTITAEDISDKTLGLSFKWGDAKDDANICFGAPTVANTGWLTNDHPDTEDLKAVLTVTVANHEMLDTSTPLTVTLVEDGGTTKLENAKNANLVTQKDINILDNKDGTFTVTVEFGWGTIFDSKNPFTYYNALKADALIGDMTAKAHALKYIKELNALNETTYKLQIKATAKTA